MSRFQKLSHVLWRCQYHLVWTPKYRYRILTGPLNKEVHNCVNIFASQLGCGIVDLNIKADHIHLIINVPPKASISQLMGTLKGRTATRVFKQFQYLKKSLIGEIIFGPKGIVWIPTGQILRQPESTFSIKKGKIQSKNREVFDSNHPKEITLPYLLRRQGIIAPFQGAQAKPGPLGLDALLLSIVSHLLLLCW